MKLRRIGKRIVAQSEFYEKDALKAAGFRWSPSDRYWWTPSVENAASHLARTSVGSRTHTLSGRYPTGKAACVGWFGDTSRLATLSTR